MGDLWALERAGVLNGLYHVLGGTLSPLDGVGPDDLSIAKLIERARDPDVKEVLLALNATVEGQSTAHYLMDQLAGANVTVSRLAHGVPIGGELDYLDEGTLAAAVKARKVMLGGMRKRTVVVNDKMQRGYRYELSAPAGPQFRSRVQARIDAARDAAGSACSAAST